MDTIIAVPSTQPGGLDAPISSHFGHCELYTLVSIESDKVENITLIPNVPHQQGGCMAPVNFLSEKGAKKLITGGIGARPLMGFKQVGIDVYFGSGVQTVGEAVNAIIQGQLPKFGQEHTCGGGRCGSLPI